MGRAAAHKGRDARAPGPEALPLAEAKLAVPGVRTGMVERPRIRRALDAGGDAALTLVAAPAGYGKTTAVRDWCESLDATLVWVTLDAGDNDPNRLWTYIATAVDRVRQGLGRGSPPFGSAKDPINFAGMVAAGVLRGDMPLSHWDVVDGGFLLDVREQIELAVERVPEAVTIPLGELRSRLDELPRDRQILVLCRSGQRAYTATRCLLQNGFDASVVSGGMLSHALFEGVTDEGPAGVLA